MSEAEITDPPRAEPALPASILPYETRRDDESYRTLLKLLLLLAWPVLTEHVLHMMVGVNDTYLANHVSGDHAVTSAAAAAVGTISYILWLIGLLTGAISTGSTAIIARATGAKHRRLANSICGQSIAAGAITGVALGLGMYFFARPIAHLTGISGLGFGFALSYLRMLCLALPFLVVMFVANACLRGAGDTLTPAISMIVVDIVNIFFSWGWTYGMFGLPKWGFNGIAAGTVVAYIAGGVIQVSVLLIGRGGIRLFLHRLRPHWHNLRRILRIGIPSGVGDFIQWVANFILLVIVNEMDPSLASSAAHNNAIKIEGISFLTGFAFATAAATMVGQSLGMKKPQRALRSAYLAYAVGGGLMGTMGLIFICFGKYPSMILSDDPIVRELTTRCLFITGFCQLGFAAYMIFGGALRGAGDTMIVMMLNLASTIFVRLALGIFVGWYLHLGLAAMWMVLASELMVRGSLIFARFRHGGWKLVQV